MKVKDILLGFIFGVDCFDIVDVKTGEVYYYKAYESCTNLIGKRIMKMPIVDLTADNGTITIWVKWHK